jgi:hypothetical protein
MDVLRDNKKSDEINELFAVDEYTAQADELALGETEAILALPRLVKAATSRFVKAATSRLQ